ncbi:MAG: oxygenase MpaB family protein [Dehalococcoidia bacterium]
MFPEGSAIRRVNQEGVLLIGGGRAILMQLAHPMVARGVAEHSTFESDPLPRLWRTLEASYTIVFGTLAQAEAVAGHLSRVHEPVRGMGYHANDPELLFWVHATLVDSALLVYRHFVGALRPDDIEEYYAQASDVAELLGVPRQHQPGSYAEFRGYMRGALATLEPSAVSLKLARSVLHPSLPFPAPLASPLTRWLTAGLLPAALRRPYGLRWGQTDQRLLQALAAASRSAHTLTPQSLRRLPSRLLRLED